jgi:hypothetical protein
VVWGGKGKGGGGGLGDILVILFRYWVSPSLLFSLSSCDVMLGMVWVFVGVGSDMEALVNESRGNSPTRLQGIVLGLGYCQ